MGRLKPTTLIFSILMSLIIASSPLCMTAYFSNVNGNWYVINPLSQNWQDAKESAEVQGGYLASITSGQENKWISDTFGIDYNGDYFWFGGNDIEVEGTWQWTNGEPWEYTNWQSGNPNNAEGLEDALTWFHVTSYNDDGYTWNDRDPADLRASLTEYDTNYIYNSSTGHWYGINPIPMTWQDAQVSAVEAGGYLASITSGQENKWISDTFGPHYNGDYYWLGGNDNEVEGTWQWTNGEPWDYTNWQSGNPDNAEGLEDALSWYHISAYNADGYTWNDRDPSQSMASLVEFDSNPLPYFSEVTSDVGLDNIPAYRISIADINSDGYPDLLLHKSADEAAGDVIDKQFLYLNIQGNNPNNPYGRKFVDFTEESGIRANRRGTTEGRHSSFAVFADVDNDGDLDMFSGLYVHRLEYYQDLGDRNDLFLNDGAGHFTLAQDTVFHDAGILNTSSAAFLDYDMDGNIDLYMGNWWENWDASISYTDKLYRGNGDGSFTDVTDSAGLNFEQPTYAVTSADWNGDGLSDLFAGNYCRSPSLHWENNGDGTFSLVQESTNYGQYTVCSWGSMPRDFDNDGDIDLFNIIVHGYDGGVHSTVLINENDVFTWNFNEFTRPDVSNPHGDHYGSWFDIDNDGLADFILSQSGSPENHLDLFKQSANHTFEIVNDFSGLDVINSLDLPPHNASSFDYDLDGDEDLIIGFVDGELGLQLWRNDVGTEKNWIVVSLTGAGIPDHSNRSAIGARVEVKAGGDTYTREVYAGNGHFGPQKPLSLTFGLGEAESVDSVRVFWPNPSLTMKEINELSANQFIDVTEDVTPALTVDIDAGSIGEADGDAAATATITRNTETTGVLDISLSSSDTTEATVQPNAQIPDGQASVTVDINAKDDAVVDGNQTVTVTASASGFNDGADTVVVTDDDTPSLTLDIDAGSIGEADGDAAATATITRNTETTGVLDISLSSSDTTEATVQPNAQIPDGQASVTVDINAKDDAVVDGNQTVTVTASASGFNDGADTVVVTDDDTPSLTLDIDAGSIGEADGDAAATATITRNTETTGVLDISLSSSDTTEATVQPNAQIPDGQASVTVDINAKDDAVVDGNQTVTVTASAPGFNDGADTVVVTDNDEVIYVEPGGVCGNFSPCYSRIQDAIDNADDGAMIRIGAGTYAENIMVDKDVTLDLCWDPDIDRLNNSGAVILTRPPICLSFEYLFISTYNGQDTWQELVTGENWEAKSNISARSLTVKTQNVTAGICLRILVNHVEIASWEVEEDGPDTHESNLSVDIAVDDIITYEFKNCGSENGSITSPIYVDLCETPIPTDRSMKTSPIGSRRNGERTGRGRAAE